MLGFDGVARRGRQGRVDGTLEVLANDVELLADGAGRTAGYTGASLSASALNRFNPVRMMVGGRLDLKPGDNYATFVSSTNNVTARAGPRSAPPRFLISGATWGGITVEEGAAIRPSAVASRPTIPARIGVRRRPDWRAGPEQRHDQPAAGHAGNGAGAGLHQYRGLRRRQHGRRHHVGRRRHLAGRHRPRLHAGRQCALWRAQPLLAMSTLNLGDEALARAAAAGALPNGLMLNQRVLDKLLKGNAGPGIPAVETLILNARDSVNVFGSVTLDATQGKGVGRLVLGAPAIYGYGARPTPRRSLARTGVDRRVRASLPSLGPVRSGDTGSGHRGPARRRPAAIGRRAHRVRLRPGHPARELAVGRTPGAGLRRRRPAGQRARDRQWPGHAQGLSPPGRVPGGQGPCLQRRRPEHRDAAADGRGQRVHGLHGGRQPDAAPAAGRGGAARKPARSARS